MFEDRIILITGGTGSFGKTVLNRFLDTNVKEIRIFSRDEKKQEQMRLNLASDKLKFYIGDVRDYGSLSDSMIDVDYVFHAAALKQVPSCEFYPMEAVRTNIIGTENMLNAAISKGVKRVVVLSTDKAVYPINSMGISKAMAEKLMVAKSRTITKSGTVICATRYGNVMGSRGSVIPLFINQIRKKEPLTITDPKMTRFLISLDDSVDLVLHAFKNSKQGDIFVQKALSSSIFNLAKALIEIFSSDVSIKIIGTRHGEKLYESLVSREEMARAEETKKYFRIPADVRDLNYNKYFVQGEQKISEFSDYTSHNSKQLDIQGVKDILMQLDYIQRDLNA